MNYAHRKLFSPFFVEFLQQTLSVLVQRLRRSPTQNGKLKLINTFFIGESIYQCYDAYLDPGCIISINYINKNDYIV